MSCDLGEVTERLENEQSFTYVTAHSPTLPLLPLQLILQLFTYVTAHSPTLSLLHLRQSPFSNPSFGSPTLQALHLRHLASRPWWKKSSGVVAPEAPQLPLLKMSPTAKDETSRGRYPELERYRHFGRRYRQSEIQSTIDYGY